MRRYALVFIFTLAVLMNPYSDHAQGRPEAPWLSHSNMSKFARTTVNQGKKSLCDPLSSPSVPSSVIAERKEREIVFVQVLQAHLARMGNSPVASALNGVIPCLKVTPVPGDDQIAAVKLRLDGDWLGGDHLVYWDGAAWRIKPLQVDRWPRYIEPKLAARTPQGLELIALGAGGGSGGAGMLQLYRLGEEMALVWEGSPSGDHLSLFPLSMEYVISIDRSPQTYRELHADQANCCLPADRETLWQRLDNRYRPSNERIIPNPYRAVSLFVGALRAGNKQLAAQYATTPELVEEAARVIREIDYLRWGSMDRGWEIQLQEALSWAVIPPHLRRPGPTVRRMVWPSGKYDLVTARQNNDQNGQWKVSDIRPAGLNL